VPPTTPEQHYRFHLHPGYQQIRIISEGATRLGIDSPFFKLHEGIAGAGHAHRRPRVHQLRELQLSRLSGHAEVPTAAKQAIDRYGTSVSASRLVSGERPVHRELEEAIARATGPTTRSPSSAATQPTSPPSATSSPPQDLMVHDELIHNSVAAGNQPLGRPPPALSAQRLGALDAILGQQRQHFQRVLIVLEGIYSMDGDYPDLPRFVGHQAQAIAPS
jgi:8-amino-7-oxononanoate synthase